MQQPSREYKKHDHTIDVHAFPAEWQRLLELIDYHMLGDIFIAGAKIREQAQRYHHSIKREWAYIFAHGLLHLIGYDHQSQSEGRVMHDKVSCALEKLGVNKDE